MKVIIAGSRSITDYGLVIKAIEESGFDITEVVSGCAIGVDTLGEQWARDECIPIKPFPVTKAQWKKYGNAAGHLRNEKMAEYVEPDGGCIIIWTGLPSSPGSKNMRDIAKRKGLNLFVRII